MNNSSSMSSLALIRVKILNPIAGKLKNSSIYKRYFRAPEMGNSFGLLGGDEMQYILALSEVFYDAADAREAKRLHHTIREWTKNRTAKDGYLKVYRGGIAAIKRSTLKEGFNSLFYELPVKKREQIIDANDYIWSDIYDKRGLKKPSKLLAFLFKSVRNQKRNRRLFFFGKMKDDIIRAIFSSQLGWDLVGIESRPGTPGDPLEYTKLPKSNISIT